MAKQIPMKQFWSQNKLWCQGDEGKVDKYGRSSCLICGRTFSLATGYSFVHEAAKFGG